MYTSMNRDSKTKKGIIGIAQAYKVVENRTMTAHLRATVHVKFKEICGAQ